jgi:hypothetical protein
MRRFTVLAIPILIVALAGCGGSSASPADNGNNGATTPPTTTSSAPDSVPSQDTSNNGGSGPADLEALAQSLIPPNSTETFKTTAEGALIVAYESTDSVDSIKGFYESAIVGAGMTVLAKTEAGGGVSLIFGVNDANTGFGGSVGIGPAGDGSGSSISITLGSGS